MGSIPFTHAMPALCRARQRPQTSKVTPAADGMLRRFQTRISLLFGGLTLAVTTLISVLVGQQLSERLNADGAEFLQGNALGVASVLAAGLTERLKDIELLAATAFTSHWQDHRAEVQTSLNRLRRGGAAYAWVGVADPAGQVHLATENMLVGENVATRPWFRSALAGAVVGDVHQAKLLAALLPPSKDGGPLRFVDFAAPIRSPDGELRGVIGAHGNFDWVSDVVIQLQGDRLRSRGVRVFIVDRQGQVIRAPRDTPPAAADAVGRQLAKDLFQGEPGVAVWPDGNAYVTAVARMSGVPEVASLGWTVVVRQPEAMAHAAARQARLQVFVTGALAALAAMAVTWWLAGRVSQPLHQIAGVARRIQRGELEVRMPSFRGSAEFEDLGEALNTMTTGLVQTQAALRGANSQLEERVLQRTEELAAANRALEQLARRDALTGLHNRRSADEQLALALARERRAGLPLSAMMVDVDHFKRVNDQHGHAVGDDVLARVARSLAEHCRLTDVVARFGGEEFLVLLPDTAPEGAEAVADKLRAAVEALSIEPVGRVTVSIGLSTVWPQPGDELEAQRQRLLHEADEALYRAKAPGRNRVHRYAA